MPQPDWSSPEIRHVPLRRAPPVTVRARASSVLRGQRPEYIERQLAEFAQGVRQNDINRQMRTIAKQLTNEEMHAVAQLYGSVSSNPLSQR